MIGVLKSAWTFGSRWKEVQFWDVFGPFVSGKILSGHALHLHWIAGAGVALLVEGVLWWIGWSVYEVWMVRLLGYIACVT